jgi:LacI family transcriptional regulator
MGGSLIVAGGGRTSYTLQKSVERMAKTGVAGLLISSAPGINHKAVEKSGPPTVWCGGVPDAPEIDRVTIDNRAGIFDLLDHLRATGAKTFGYAQSCKRRMGEDSRSLAFTDYLKTHGLRTKKKWQVSSSREGEGGGRALLRQFRKGGALPDAIVCCNDWTAVGVIREALERDIAVPGALKVTGFDNLLLSSYLQVPLTTIDYRIPELVSTAISLLRAKLGNPRKAPESVLLTGRLVVRASTAG